MRASQTPSTPFWGSPPADLSVHQLQTLVAVQLESLRLMIDALDKLTDAKFVTFRTLVDSQAEKVKLALDAADKAVLKAERATEDKFEKANEFRGQLEDQARTFATRREQEALQASLAGQLDTMRTALTELTRRIDITSGKSAGVSSSFGGIAAVIAAVAAVAAIVSVIFVLAR